MARQIAKRDSCLFPKWRHVMGLDSQMRRGVIFFFLYTKRPKSSSSIRQIESKRTAKEKVATSVFFSSFFLCEQHFCLNLNCHCTVKKSQYHTNVPEILVIGANFTPREGRRKGHVLFDEGAASMDRLVQKQDFKRLVSQRYWNITFICTLMRNRQAC